MRYANFINSGSCKFKNRFHLPLQRRPSSKFLSSGFISSGRIKELLTICRAGEEDLHLDFSMQQELHSSKQTMAPQNQMKNKRIKEHFEHLVICILQCFTKKWILSQYHIVQSNSHCPCVSSSATIGETC